MKIYRSEKKVFYKGKEVNLTPTPFRLLLALAINPGVPIYRSELVKKASKQAREQEINDIKWLKDNKYIIMKAFRKLIDDEHIIKNEIEILITVENETCTLNLSGSNIMIE